MTLLLLKINFISAIKIKKIFTHNNFFFFLNLIDNIIKYNRKKLTNIEKIFNRINNIISYSKQINFLLHKSMNGEVFIVLISFSILSILFKFIDTSHIIIDLKIDLFS